MSENVTPSNPSQFPEPPGLLYRPATVIVRVLVSSLATGVFADIGLMAIAAVADQWYPNLFNDAVPLQGNDDMALMIAFVAFTVIRLMAFILSAVMFCVWVFRASKNVRALGTRRMRFSAGLCVVWFFVPIMSLFKPYQAVREIYVCSNPEVPENARYEGESLQLLGWWWAAWIAALVLANVSDPETENMSMWGSVPGNAAGILAAILAIAVVVKIHRRQERKAFLNPQLLQAVCMGCGYDLRASAGEACPECGQAIPGREPTV